MKTFPKRDFLLSLEEKAQDLWLNDKIFESDYSSCQQKFVATFPFPYMNGRLHLGHTFSITKPEFAIGYQRLKGKNCLFPFGFHCTGMPIKAAADKLKKEISMFGNMFEGYSNQNDAPKPLVEKHGKAAAKSTGLTFQFQIMESMGVPRDEIHKFADPKYWCYFFPPIAMVYCFN